MLTELLVQELALVEKIRIPFAPGLNVITGETGAGKSVLMGALNLILGARADKKVLRSGADQGTVQAVFELADPAAVNRLLEEAGLEPCEEGQLIIRRVIRGEGSGQQRVNDQPATLNLLRAIGDVLVDMHGPYDHQSILDPDTQRRLVDSAGVSAKSLETYRATWRRWRELNRKRADLEGDEGQLDEQLDLLRYRVKELEDADLEIDEEEQLREEHTLAGNSQNIMESLSGALQALEEAEGNALDALAGGRRCLQALVDLHPEADTWLEELEQAQRQLQELAATVRLAGESTEVDPARLDWLDQRLAVYSRMRKKYGPTVGDALRTLEESKAKLEALENREQTLADLETDLAACRKELDQHGAALRKEREKAGKALAGRIREQVVDLGFPHARFDIAVTTEEPGPHGTDGIDFLFAPNPGEDIRSLKDIASSGEISRVMLAIKTLLADQDRIPVMVFDEIDANVGGEMGHAIGAKMKEAGRTRQVISITHLPQVAVHGDQHLAVAKEVTDGRTYTRVRVLEAADREQEVARMLGGTRKAKLSLDHARELLRHAGS
jgi:DNA repair protein RecN (Recombination protein N)